MEVLLCLVIAFIPVVYAGNCSYWQRFDRQVTLDSVKAREFPWRTQALLHQETCIGLCTQDELCTALTYLNGTCSMYRSSLTSSGESVPGSKHFIKAGALPDPDPCPVSMGYTSVVSPRLCYKITPNGSSSSSLSSLCQSEGGRLVVLNSQEKQEFMASLQRHDDVPGTLWVGMQRLENNVFTWQDGSTYVWMWGSNQPNDIADQICVVSFNGEFSNRNCNQKNKAVCEIPM
ncbi:C-type lectin lectoxin-Lio2-like [Haliotis rubra]|uniref:C-type lectin lectoxin-Lio2-like n=1 Tax=Haliotis rubra TaxID=36100 RepID=UPI001EE5BE25|nr:C-type lectin lectoxin-Lio2-like [Haliotis rubra]